MARLDEATLFRPDPKMQPAAGGRSGAPAGASSGGGFRNEDDEGPNIAIRQRLAEAARAAFRRKALSLVVIMFCAAVTVLSAIFAPRNYEVDARVLVQRTQAITGGQGQPLSPEEMRNLAKEYEEQVLAHDNILAIVQQTSLVARWEEMRQPHRRFIDKLRRKLGKAPASDDEKFEALTVNLKQRLKVWVDGATVTIKLEWSEPESAREIVDAAVKNFLEARFQSEVGVIPERLKILEAVVAQAHRDLEASATELVRQQRGANPRERVNVAVPVLPQGVRAEDPSELGAKARLEGVRQQIAAIQDGKSQREANLVQEIAQKRHVLAEAHPEMIALKQALEAARAESPQLVRLRAEERELLAELASKPKGADARAGAHKVPPAPAPVVEPPVVGSTKSVQDAQVLFDTVSRKYSELTTQLEAARIEMKTAEAAFKNRYKVVHPPEVPTGPKRPIGLLATLLGLLGTFVAVLFAAALADRLSGIFYEPRDVRDRLGLPVFATFS
jgi:uncharacterized protein involved in exopolysaccharide biosynthesis